MHKMNIGVLVQARTRSTRLPGKVLLPFGGDTVLDTVLDRVMAADVGPAAIVTTHDPADDDIVSLATRRDVPCVRGPEDDVLDRYRIAADQLGFDVLVRITADCPFVWPGDIARAVEQLTGEISYTSNDGCIAGLSVEAMTASALVDASRAAGNRYDREHVTPWLRRHAHRHFFLQPGRPTAKISA